MKLLILFLALLTPLFAKDGVFKAEAKDNGTPKQITTSKDHKVTVWLGAPATYQSVSCTKQKLDDGSYHVIWKMKPVGKRHGGYIVSLGSHTYLPSSIAGPMSNSGKIIDPNLTFTFKVPTLKQASALVTFLQ